MRAFATVLVFTTAASLQGADGTLRLSLADSPCPGLRERVETHLAQSYECVVLSRSRCAAAQFEKAVEKMGTIQAPALPEEVQPTCDRCVWVNAWNDDQYQQVPAAGLREIAWSVADVTRQLPMTNRICRERVPERSAYEQALAESIAAQLRLAPRAEATLSAPKGVTLAVLPFVRRSDDSSVRYDKSLPADQTYLRAEAALPGCLPAGARILARDKIRQILAEHQLSALADSGTGLRAAAHLLPADTLLCGTVSRRFLRPKELRLDLHLVDSRSSVLQAAWQGCCTNQADLPDLAAQGVNALMTMPWRTADAGASSDDNRRREAECLIGHGCFAEAWDLARACPDLYAPILNGVLCQAEVYCYADATDANHDTFERQMLREAALTLDDVLGAKTYLDSEKANVPWPDLIRAEIHFWLGEHADAERLCRAHLSEHPNDLTARAKLILAWALYGQKRFDESRARFNEAIAEKGLMWYFPRLGGKSGWYWANSLSVKLANASGDDGALYDQVRQKMRDRKLVYEPEMQAYLREVDRRLTPGEVVRELSSVLIYDTGDSLLPELVAQRPLDLAYRGWFRHLSPAYVVRGRCHEKLGQPQQAAEDYAMYLKICRCPFTADNRLSGDAKPKSGYEAEAVDGLSRLQKRGILPRQRWLPPAESRTFPEGLRFYVVPVGLYDRETVGQFVAETARFLGAPVTRLPDVALPHLTPLEDKKGTRYFDAPALCSAVLKGLAVPEDVVQLVLVTSEDFRFPANEYAQKMGSPDNGATLLLSVKDPKHTRPEHLKRTLARALHYRYAAPVSERHTRLDANVTDTFLRTWDHCSEPCLFSEEASSPIQSGDALPLLCPRCQEAYKRVDFGALHRQTAAALKAQGVKIVPAAARSARQAAGELERE